MGNLMTIWFIACYWSYSKTPDSAKNHLCTFANGPGSTLTDDKVRDVKHGCQTVGSITSHNSTANNRNLQPVFCPPCSYVSGCHALRRDYMRNTIILKLENVAIIATYCHLRPPDAIAFPTYHLLGLQIRAADEPNVFSSRVAVGCHVNAA